MHFNSLRFLPPEGKERSSKRNFKRISQRSPANQPDFDARQKPHFPQTIQSMNAAGKGSDDGALAGGQIGEFCSLGHGIDLVKPLGFGWFDKNRFRKPATETDFGMAN